VLDIYRESSFFISDAEKSLKNDFFVLDLIDHSMSEHESPNSQ
jgi:hypothetical protein